jgi:hypothetical protein
MSIPTDGRSKVEIIQLCVDELRGLGEDLEKAGLARPRPTKSPLLCVVPSDNEKATL